MKRAAILATARYARRTAGRARWRSALIIAMIGLPIGGLAAAGVIVETVVPTAAEQEVMSMGTADVEYRGFDGPFDEDAARALLPRGSRIAVTRTWYHGTVAAGRRLDLQIDQPGVPVDRPPVRGIYLLLSGRVPGRGEAIVHPDALEALEASVGQEATIAGQRIRVVGTVAKAGTYRIPLVVVGPNTIEELGEPQAFDIGMLVDLPRAYGVEENRAALEQVGSFIAREEVSATIGQDRVTMEAALFGATVVALIGTGLIAAAAFVVGARRQLRALGLLGAAGAEPSHVRAAVLWGGTSLGLAASALGVALGVGVAALLRPHMDRLFDRGLIGPLDVSMPLIVGAVALGTIAATAAAYTPARWAGRIPVVAALDGRTPAPRPAGKLARAGIAIAAIGLLLVGRGTVSRDGGELALGLAVGLVGFLLAIPIVVTLVGRAAPMLPAPVRVAARDTARHGRRTAAAVAAATLALALPVGVSALTLSQERAQRNDVHLDPHQMIVGAFADDTQRPSHGEIALAIRRALPGATVVRLARAVPATSTPGLPGFAEQSIPWVQGGTRTVVTPDGGRSTTVVASPLYVGDDDLLTALGWSGGRDALRRGTIVGGGEGSVVRGTVEMMIPVAAPSPEDGGPLPPKRVPAVQASSPTAVDSNVLPRYVISEAAARELGLRPERGGMLLVRTARPYTGGDLAAVRRIADRDGLYVQVQDDYASSSAALRAAANGTGIAVGLIVVAVAVALVGAESRRDMAILSAVGASPRTRRVVAAARAGLLALSAAVLAVPAGFLPIAVVQSARSGAFPVVVPWLAIAIVAVAMPALAALAAALASRSPRPVAMLRPIS